MLCGDDEITLSTCTGTDFKAEYEVCMCQPTKPTQIAVEIVFW